MTTPPDTKSTTVVAIGWHVLDQAGQPLGRTALTLIGDPEVESYPAYAADGTFLGSYDTLDDAVDAIANPTPLDRSIAAGGSDANG
jgi:hypothetical protein